jgi:hypothetical protein
LAASQTLSQLSYGPVVAKCSVELEFLGQVDPCSLFVPCACQPKVDLRLAVEKFDRQKVVAVELSTVERKGVDLMGRVQRFTSPSRARRFE